MKKFLTSKQFLGIVVANLFALLIIGLQTALSNEKDGILIFSEFVIIPLLMGIISAWFWKDLDLKWKGRVGYSILNGLTTILLSYFFLKEGVICLLIVSPLIFGLIITGVFIGKPMFKRNNQEFNVSLVGVLMLVYVIDATSVHKDQHMVSDQIVINASPAKIWEHVVAFDEIKKQEKYWLFQMGMPSPKATTVSAYQLGANRKCIFSNGYVFDEKISTFDVNKNLIFEIVGQPKDPEIMGHINIQKGQFLLKDNGDGTTTLIGNSWYSLHVFPITYYNIWAESITRNVHLRVMEHIKELSEAQ